MAISLNKGEIPVNIKHTKEVDSDEEDSKHASSADEEFRICLHRRNSTLDPIVEEDEDELVEIDTVRESLLYVNLSDITEIEDESHVCQFSVCENCGDELLLSNQDAIKTFNILRDRSPAPTADKSSSPRKLKKLAELQDAGLRIE